MSRAARTRRHGGSPAGSHRAEGSRASRRRRGSARFALAIGLALLVPIAVVLVIGLWGASWHAAGDRALQVLRVRDVGTSHSPLVGVYSRFGWHHPGPVQFWMLAPFYRLFGEPGILAGTALANVAALAGSVWLAGRVGGRSLAALVALASAALVRALTVSFLLDPWNPWVAVLPFELFVLAVLAVGVGDLVALPVLVAAGSFSVQVHVSFAPLVAAGVVAAACLRLGVALGRRRRRAGRCLQRGARRRHVPLVVAALILVVLWLPTAFQQLTGDPGNVFAILHYFEHPTAPSAGWTEAVGVLGRQLAPVGPWMSGHDTGPLGLVATSGVLPASVVLVVVAALGLAAWRRGARRPALFTALVLGGDLVGTVATARVTGLMASYLVRWWWPLAALTFVAGAWSAVALAAPALRRLRVPALAAGGAAVLAMALVAAVTTAPATVPMPRYSAATARLSAELLPRLDPRRTYLVEIVDSVNLGAVGVGVFLELRRAGFQVFRPPSSALAVGRWRTLAPGAAPATLFVVNEADRRAGWSPPAGARLVARQDNLAPAERRTLTRLDERVRASLGPRAPTGPVTVPTAYARDVLVAEGASRADVDRLAALRARSVAFSVYVTPN